VKPLFDNEHFIAVDKAPGVLTVPSRMGAQDARPCLGKALELELGVRLWPIHRLDLEVSGLVLFAKHADAHRAASAWFSGRDMRKVYEALTEHGRREPAPGEKLEWHSRLSRGKRRAFETAQGKAAITRAHCLGPRSCWLAWLLEPLTGRPHQLRFHLARHGFPVAGDALYGAREPYVGPGIALRAVLLEFEACGGREAYGLPERLRVAGLI
jgi:tRNA pseudouridine32 synthase/23S rRNA pseudouridine746 synthase